MNDICVEITAPSTLKQSCNVREVMGSAVRIKRLKGGLNCVRTNFPVCQVCLVTYIVDSEVFHTAAADRIM